MKKLYLLLLIFFIAATSIAQTSSCAQTIRLAQSIYDQGRLHELENLITKQIDKGDCSTAEKVSLYKLLTLAYIYLEEPVKADDSMLKLIQTDHYFEINPAVDPAEFVALYNTFRTKPIYRIGAKLGVNASRPNVANSVTSVELAADSEYKFAFAILFGGAIDVPIHFRNKNDDRFTLHGELLYWQKKFEIDQKVDRGTDSEGKMLTNSLIGFETQTWLSLPLSFEYKFLDKKYNPYAAGGVAIDYLLAGKVQTQRLRDNVISVQEATYNIKQQRNPINVSALLAAGVKLKMGGGFFVAEIRYVHGLTNVNSSETVYDNQFEVWNQGYPDSIFKVSSLAISGSYVINVFNPKKKKL
ncbi:MAG: PorT family protein [Cyclobacteriaceae bacterium]|nr:PorT family protein [Cyclobacteriaceae bacterium]